MRMWMTDVKMLCRQHLLGEHRELHMIVGSLEKQRQIWGYIANNLIEPRALKKRHNAVVLEMQKRGYDKNGHKTPMKYDIRKLISYLPKEVRNYKVNTKYSLKDLLYRCEECRKNERHHGN